MGIDLTAYCTWSMENQNSCFEPSHPVTSGIDLGKLVGLVFFDFKKAFNMVPDVPKIATDLKNSDISCFKLIVK